MRTKDEEKQDALFEATVKLVNEIGFAASSVAKIAKEAGVTRGAIYWHFKNKPDLFFAMMEQVSLPLIDRIDGNLPADNPGDPLLGIEASMLEVLRLLKEDDIARTTFEIVVLKCEYVDEFASLESSVIKTGCAFIEKATRAYTEAQKKGLVRGDIDPAQFALESYTFMKGLIQLWLSDVDATLIRGKAQSLIKAHIAMRYK